MKKYVSDKFYLRDDYGCGLYAQRIIERISNGQIFDWLEFTEYDGYDGKNKSMKVPFDEVILALSSTKNVELKDENNHKNNYEKCSSSDYLKLSEEEFENMINNIKFEL